VKRERIDRVLVKRGLVQSRERAQSLIMEGKIRVEGRVVDKPGTAVEEEASVEILGEDLPYVSRGGLKLEGALAAFSIDPSGMTVMDVGASTGGFTDCMLQKGAQKIYAIDVGYGQLAWKLRNDPRVIILEKTNARYLRRDAIEGEVDLILVDASFISIEKILPHLLGFLMAGGTVIALIKPQFEVGKGEVGKGGVVRDPSLHEKVVGRISRFFEDLGLSVLGVVESPLLGPKGNKEFFIHMAKPSVPAPSSSDGNGLG
jgi:23S rRNA (cytidine1920-2'-O)/16S rRNA (cytidine1409-2'-O)-methyltransferase